MFLDQIYLNNRRYTIVFLDAPPSVIIKGSTIQVFKGNSVSEKLRNYVSALLTAQAGQTKLPKNVTLETACQLVETLIAPPDTEVKEKPRTYSGTGYKHLGAGIFSIERDGA